MVATPATPAGRQQRTIRNPVEYRGIGLHSGKEIRIVVRPAEAGTGVTFVRTDIEQLEQTLTPVTGPRERVEA